MAVVENGGVLLPTSGMSSSPISAGSLLMYSGRHLDYEYLYRTQPNLRLVIRFLSRNIAQLGLKGYRRIDDANREGVPRDSELGQFLRSPTPDASKPVTRHRWIRAIVSDLALYDDAYLVKRRNPVSGRLNAFRIPPPRMTPETLDGDSSLFVSRYRLDTVTGPVYFEPSEVIHFHGDNPGDPRRGVSSIESLRRVLAEDAAAGEWREQFWQNAARKSGYLTRPVDAPKWSSGAKERFLTDFRDNWSGRGGEAGGTPLLEDGMTFTDSAFSAIDSEYLGARRLSREECAAAYFIPPVFVGILENANFANIKEQHVSLYADTLGPWLDELTEDLELQLLPEFAATMPYIDEVYLEFNIAAKLEGSFEEQAAAMQTSTGAPWLLRNEARARMNLPPVEGGDELVVPLNVLIGGQASPTDSAPPAGEIGTAARTAPTKSRRALTGWEAAHRAHLSNYFGAQGELVVERLRLGMTLAEAMPAPDWDAELSNLLFGLALEMTDELGTATADQFGADFDLSRTEAYLRRNADIAATRINGATRDALELAWSGVSPRRGTASAKASLAVALEGIVELEDIDLADPFGDAFLDPVRAVFDLAKTARATEVATTRTTELASFSTREAASQSGARTKTWVTNSANSRHADVDGETVPLGETFSNGADGPGDWALGVDGVAGCQCTLEFS